MKKYLVEFIGTFFLVFTVGAAVRSGTVLAPIAIGSVLMVMVYAGGHVSGGHFNPAVTLAAWIRGKFAAKDVAPYWIAQLLAGVVAGLIVVAVFDAPLHGAAWHATKASLEVEFLFTFALAWVVLNTATVAGTAGNSFYGLAIGFTLLVGVASVGEVSGGAFNPAVGLGVYVMGLESMRQLIIYLVADLLGGAAAALAFKATHEIGE